MTAQDPTQPAGAGRAAAVEAAAATPGKAAARGRAAAQRAPGRDLFVLGGAGVAGFLLLMAALAWLTEASGAGAADAVDAATGTITLALSTEPPQLDSTRATDLLSGRILGHVMEGLLRYDASDRIAPGVAWDWRVEGTEAIFRLREDARWSDGAPVTAHDFVYAWRTALDPATASQYAFILHPIEHGAAINRGELPPASLGATAVDDLTLAVRLERPTPHFEKLVAFPTYFPIREAFREGRQGRYGADAEDLLYNGPFVIASWVHGASLRMERNPHYWNQERIHLNAIDYAYITSDVNAVLNLRKDGKVAIASLNAETLEDALQRRWQLKRFVDGSVFFIEFNHRPERLTANLNLRRAIQLVTDPAELVYKVIKVPGNLPGESLFPVWLKGVHGTFRQEYPAPTQRVDVERAQTHLARAAAELDIGGEWPPLVLLSGDNPAANKQAEYFQEVYRARLGLDVKIDRQIFKQRLAKMTAGEFDMVLAGWGPDYKDPLTFGDLFASWNENNRGRYMNPTLDGWVEVAQTSPDTKRRMEAFAVIQRIIHEDAVVLPSYESGSVYVQDERLRGVVRRAVGTDPDFTEAYIALD